MPPTEQVRQLAEQYDQLNDEDRRDFAHLVGAVDNSEITQEWSQELHSRADDIDSGRVQLIDGDDFLKRLSQA